VTTWGDVARVERGLHPDLVKRRVLGPTVHEQLALRRMGRDELVALTPQGVLVTPPAQWKAGCTVLEVVAGIAVVRADTPIFVDHLQLAASATTGASSSRSGMCARPPNGRRWKPNDPGAGATAVSLPPSSMRQAGSGRWRW